MVTNISLSEKQHRDSIMIMIVETMIMMILIIIKHFTERVQQQAASIKQKR